MMEMCWPYVLALRFSRIFRQLVDKRFPYAPFSAYFRLSFGPAIDCRCIPHNGVHCDRLRLIPRVDLPHSQLDPKSVERSRRRRDLFLPNHLCKPGGLHGDAGLHIRRVALRPPLLTDLQRLLDSKKVIRSMFPNAIVYAVPVVIEYEGSRAVSALNKVPCGDLFFIDLANDDRDGLPEITG